MSSPEDWILHFIRTYLYLVLLVSAVSCDGVTGRTIIRHMKYHSPCSPVVNAGPTVTSWSSDCDCLTRVLSCQQADEAYHIGPAASHLSYLNQQTITKVSKMAGVQVSWHGDKMAGVQVSWHGDKMAGVQVSWHGDKMADVQVSWQGDKVTGRQMTRVTADCHVR